MAPSPHTSWKRALGDVFSFGEARIAGLRQREIYQLRDDGVIISMGNGLYRWDDTHTQDLDLVEIAERVPESTLCLETALSRHGLIDAVPHAIDVALPRGAHRPRFARPVRLHTFDLKTFEIGRETTPVGPRHRIGLYSPERCIVDVVRMRHAEGQDLAWEALRGWLVTRGRNPAKLLRMAAEFHGAERPLRLALQILL